MKFLTKFKQYKLMKTLLVKINSTLYNSNIRFPDGFLLSLSVGFIDTFMAVSCTGNVTFILM